MSALLDIPAGHHRGVWVFSADLSEEALAEMKGDAFTEALGLWNAPDSAYVERFDLDTMEDYGFARYLSEANGMDISETDAEVLNAMTGRVVLVFSQALSNGDTRFAPEPPFELAGRYGVPVTLPTMESLKSDGAEGLLPQGKPPKSDARMSGMVATFVLIFLAIFVAAFVWIGG